jgi:hypothetical protein
VVGLIPTVSTSFGMITAINLMAVRLLTGHKNKEQKVIPFK